MVAPGDSSCQPSAAARRELGPLLCSSSRLCAEGLTPLAQGLAGGKETRTQALNISKSSLLPGVWWLQANAWDGACATRSRELAGPCCVATGVLSWHAAESCRGSPRSDVAEVDPLPWVPPPLLVDPPPWAPRCQAGGQASPCLGLPTRDASHQLCSPARVPNEGVAQFHCLVPCHSPLDIHSWVSRRHLFYGHGWVPRCDLADGHASAPHGSPHHAPVFAPHHHCTSG